MTQWNSSYYRNKNYNRIIKGSIDSIIYDVHFLPVEPEICSVFLESIKKQNYSSTDLTKFITLSPSLTFNLLNLVHSSFYGNKNITSLNDALKAIGNDIVIHLIKDFLIRSSALNKSHNIEPGINSHYYGSLKSAHLATLVSEELKFSSPFTAYTAALLHNVGSIVLKNRFPIQYDKLSSSVNNSYLEQVSEEEYTLGVNHCYLGARMIEHWDSFPFIADALFYHHHPLKKVKQASKLVQLIYFSGMLDNQREADLSLIIETGKELFNFSADQINEYISIAELKVQNRLLHLGIEVSDNYSSVVYRSNYLRETVSYSDMDNNSLLSTLIDHVRNSEDEKDVLKQIGKSIHLLTGLSEILYFKHNKDNNSLDGYYLKSPENTEFSNDFSIPMNAKSSIIVTSFLMGLDINSLDRVSNAEPALFDLQIANYLGLDGLYCLPLVDGDKTIGVIVLGINPGGIALESETVKRLCRFTEAVVPLLSDEEVKESTESADIKNAESSLLQTRKLIHEINNPLSAIKNYLKVLGMKLDDINVENDEIRIMDDELNRIAKLLKEFKSSSSDKNKTTTSSLNRIISDTILLIKNSRVNGPEISIGFEMDEDTPDIMIDKDAFRQVLINLINNSIEAMPMGGNISLDVRYKNGLQQGNNNGKVIEISIVDNGPGFPDHLKSNLFKNQSTTKADHDGIGLLIVHELVKKMGGNVILDEHSDKGACFKITLPVN